MEKQRTIELKILPRHTMDLAMNGGKYDPAFLEDRRRGWRELMDSPENVHLSAVCSTCMG